MRIKRQQDVKDCGPLVVQALHHHFYKEWISLNQIKSNVDFGTKGISMSNLISLSSKYGIKSKAYEADIDSIIKSGGNEYMIALVDSNGMNHYVIFKYKDESFEISDSINGSYKLTKDEFTSIYRGSVLSIEKTDYVSEEIDITNPMKYLAKNWNIVIWISISLFLSIIFTFVTSLFMKIVIDKIIPGKLDSTLKIVALSFAFLAALKASNGLLRSYLIKKLSIHIERDLTFTFFDKLNHARYKDLSKMTINDNLRRIGLIGHVSGFISNSFFVVFNEFAMLVVSTSLLLWISPSLFSITLGVAGIMCLITVLFRVMVRTKFDDLIKNQMDLFNVFVDSVNQNKELKLPSNSKMAYRTFNSKFFKSKQKEYEIWSFNALQHFIESVIEFTTPILLVYIGTKSIFQDKMTIGSLLMFLSIFNSFISPVKDLSDFFLQLPQMQKNIDLISFIINMKEEVYNKNGLKLKDLKTIQFKNFKTGYDRDIIQIDDYLIEGNIKLKGKNGTGKSTLLNAIATTYETKGELLFNIYEKDFYSLENLRESIAVVSPSTYIPNVSVLEYATLGDEKAIELLMKNSDKFNLAGLMKSLDISFDTPLINNGQNISSGQRQIVTLLRLFSFKYELIILDEAFENIDTHKLKGIKKALNTFQKALFIEVSHSGKYITNGKVVDIEKINKYT